MQPTDIIESGEIKLLGLSFYGDPFAASAEWTEENEIGRLWSRFHRYLGKQPGLSAHANRWIELHIEHSETHAKGIYEVFVGIEVATFSAIPVDWVAKLLPASTYTKFTLQGQQIISDWYLDVYQIWLPKSGYRIAHKYSMLTYDSRFLGMDKLDESEVDIYLPICMGTGE
ncbi:GyrI-like domain-containing protein [candidate division KSB1 bacterium]|nr:GyrI-like domain-containing protein [candidate division KSB1 bacterium]